MRPQYKSFLSNFDNCPLNTFLSWLNTFDCKCFNLPDSRAHAFYHTIILVHFAGSEISISRHTLRISYNSGIQFSGHMYADPDQTPNNAMCDQGIH